MDGRKSSRQESEKAARGSSKTLENEEERRGADRREGWRGSSPPGCLCYGAGGRRRVPGLVKVTVHPLPCPRRSS